MDDFREAYHRELALALDITDGVTDGEDQLPEGWALRKPVAAETPGMTRLLAAHQERVLGTSRAAWMDVDDKVLGRGAEFRFHRIAKDADGEIRGWVSVADRAVHRVLVDIHLDPAVVAGELPGVDAAALWQALMAWGRGAAQRVAQRRGVSSAVLDSSPYAEDPFTLGMLERAGFHKARTWWQMRRPVAPEEADPEVLGPPKEGLVVRMVDQNTSGRLPNEEDLRAVHAALEDAFQDHFDSHPEPFLEFVSRLREDRAHRWDHWWLAELAEDGTIAGAVISAAILDDGDLQEQLRRAEEGLQQEVPTAIGTYIEYIGVTRAARGRGAAKGLLHAVIRDAAERGREFVDLEVDADSPTGAQEIYSSMGWRTKYVTETWHATLTVD
ncbi:Acetyltransferase (GNAT) family protein [Kytococcus aerolatus]|uniref:Acetyltransferase (GNAT) family protein n=1 Tax=Kytococcus aerolatus TaxID=592308 RepID=A0A212T6J0_9MICO|nr:GNAT family N-acetyltransferase [Kytococcus aerolatus]SNC61648.1 Acetyltransferase (GNAT) family protein [Kytococcus aerolatus]